MQAKQAQSSVRMEHSSKDKQADKQAGRQASRQSRKQEIKKDNMQAGKHLGRIQSDLWITN